MKIKSIRFENNPLFGNSEFCFTDAQGRVVDVVVFAGENGCGKTQLLNTIYDFSNLSITGEVRNEKRHFTVLLSEEELLHINSFLDDRKKLVSPTGEMVITENLNQSGSWQRLLIEYQSISDNGQLSQRQIDSSHFLSGTNNRSVFKSIFSTVEINYSPKDSSTVTSKEIDEDVSTSLRSGNDLATEIQQLLIDIQDNDAHELADWVADNPESIPPDKVINRRIKRFKAAFSKVFEDLNFHKIITENNKKKAYFKKHGHDVDIASLSSGEKQIVFRGAFLLRNQQSTKGSLVLIDEPEISLHPVWQTKIFDYYCGLFTGSSGEQTSQMFIATHSQYVLTSALENHAKTLIVILKDTGDFIEATNMNAPLALPRLTAAELNYVAFGIASNDYHIELYGHLQNIIAQSKGNADCTVKEADSYIESQTSYYSPSKHEKPSSYVSRHGTISYKTLPTYIRNAIDHPDPSRTYSHDELITSIKLLIQLC